MAGREGGGGREVSNYGCIQVALKEKISQKHTSHHHYQLPSLASCLSDTAPVSDPIMYS
jgi:hypothetical protein